MKQLIVAILVLLIKQCAATHFRFSTISWDQVTGGQGRYFKFTIDSAWRRTFFNKGNFVVGNRLAEPNTFFYPSTASGAKTKFNFEMFVNSINVAADWFIGQQIVYFEFESDGTYVSAFEACCRIKTLLNNPEYGFRVQTTVLVVRNALRKSIKTTTIPIVTLISGQQASFSIPSLSQENEVLRYRLASASEATEDKHEKNYKNPNGLSVDYFSGTLRWLSTRTGLSSVQVVIEGHAAGSNPQNTNDRSKLQTTVAVDFLLEVINPTESRCKRFCSNLGSPCGSDSQCFSCVENGFASLRTPYCDPNFAPVIRRVFANGFLQASSPNYIVEAVSGIPFTLSIVADDADPEDLVTVTSTAIPQGASFQRTVANPGAINVTWTPSVNQGGSIICFTASDSLLNPSTGQTCVEVRVKLGDMLAYGTGLTRTIAGQPTTIQIDNAASPSRTHSVTISGAQSHTTNSDLVSSSSPRGANYALYNATYNPNGPNAAVITQAGFYTLTIAETTGSIIDKPPNLIYSLQVVPDVAFGCEIFDSGAAGLSGGIERANLSFLIRSKDRFGNNVETNRATDNYQVTISYNGNNLSSIASPLSDGIYRGAYTVPNKSGSDSTFRIIVSLMGGNICAIKTASIDVEPFNAFITAQNSYTAGEDVVFTVTRTRGNQDFSAFVNNMQAEISPGTTSGANTIYTARLSGGLTQAGPYLNRDGIRISTSGFEIYESFVLVANDAIGPNCFVSGDLTDAAAGEDAVVTVQLRDAYDNIIGSDSDSIDYKFVHSLTTEGVLSGRAQFDELTRLYKIGYTFTRTGSVTLNLTLGSSNSSIAASPYIVLITPGEISLTQSAVSNPETVSAGVQGVLTITALDNYVNARDPNLDSFQISFASAKSTGNTTLIADRTSNKYFVTFYSTVTGLYSLTIRAFLPSQGGFLVFRTISIKVTAGDVVPASTSGSGAGMSGGVVGQQSQLLIQTRDQYENVVQEERGLWVVVKVMQDNPDSEEAPPTYAMSTYRPPSTNQCVSPGPLYVLESSNIDDLTPDEQLLSSEGYFEVFYQIPRVGPYTLTVFLARKDEVDASMDGAAILALPSTKETFSNTALSRAAGSEFTTEDNMGLIIGLVLGSIVLASASMYGLWRLRRYREKYHVEKRRADAAEKDLEEMAAEIDIIPGRRDYEAIGAATVTANPLHELHTNYPIVAPPPVPAIEDPHDITMRSEEPAAIRKEFKPVKFSSPTSLGVKDEPLARARSPSSVSKETLLLAPTPPQ
jgi:hypothetical protein